eukprot:2243578-Pleurochrysis_carterae.AAC.1
MDAHAVSGTLALRAITCANALRAHAHVLRARARCVWRHVHMCVHCAMIMRIIMNAVCAYVRCVPVRARCARVFVRMLDVLRAMRAHALLRCDRARACSACVRTRCGGMFQHTSAHFVVEMYTC